MTVADSMPPAETPGELQVTDVEAQQPVTPQAPANDGLEYNGELTMGNMLTAQNMEMLLEQEMDAADRFSNELLRNVFDSMATNGRITLDQLPFVLVGAEVQATAKEIEDAIEEQIPDCDDADALLDFQQVEALFQQLMHNSLDNNLANDTQAFIQAKPSLWRRLVRWWEIRQQQRKLKATAYEKHMKPTTRLLLLILATSCTISLAVVLFAIIFIWNHSTNTVQNHVLRDVQLMKNGLDLFGYQKPFENYQYNTKRLASMTSLIVEELGYKGTRETIKANLQYQELLLSTMLDGWFDHDMGTRVSTSATLMKGWVERILNETNETFTVDFVNRLNPTLPAGHEIVLSHLNATNNHSIYLTTFRFLDQCLNKVCGSDPTAGAPTRAALQGQTGTMFGMDYRPKMVVAGYTYITSAKMGLVYQIERDMLRDEFDDPVTTVVDSINLAYQQEISEGLHTQELVLAKNNGGKTQILSRLNTCGATCLKNANVQGSPLTTALAGGRAVIEAKDFDGQPVLEAYGNLPLSGLGVAVKMARAEFEEGLYQGLGESLDTLNTKLPDTEEMQLAVGVVTKVNTTNGTAYVNSTKFLTKFKFPADCNGACGGAGTSPYVDTAIATCAAGEMEATDYRGQQVTAGYSCVPSLRAGIVMKVDHKQILREGIELARVIATHQNDVRFANSTVEFVVAQKKPGVDVPESARDYTRITTLKLRAQCPNMTCTGPSHHMVSALRHEEGVSKGPDYRNTQVIGAYAYVESLDVGIVVKVDATEAEASSLALALQLSGCSVSAVFVSMLVLAVLTSHLLRAMDRAWDEGKKAIEREKQQFSNVIQAMYPPQVAKRLLAGETQIVYNVASACVFFSDIYEFTTTSNAVTPEELIQFMGYTFGVMDAAADHFHIYKVKTIGDAYLGVSGLPGSENMSGNNVLDMLLFASCCAQVFSNRYIHPEDGAILTTVAKTLFGGKKKTVKMADEPQPLTKRPSQIIYNNPSIGGGEAAAGVVDNGIPQVHCVMRYGVAAGPITAGVLQGKTPLFDIWGKTVNLASRMESTGTPGRIQVSEAVYQTVVVLKEQPFMFDARHKVYCKSFGNVSAYFIGTCRQPPPKELLTKLEIEPNLGHFYFDNAVPGFKTGSKGTGSGGGSIHDTASQGRNSARSSVVSGAGGLRGGGDLV